MNLRILPLLALAVSVVVAAPQSKRDNDPDMKELHDYRLSMDKIQRYVAAYQTMAKNPAAMSCFKEKEPGNLPLNEGQKVIESCPAVVAGLKSAGFTPREFLVMTASLIGGVFAMELKHSGQIKAYPPETISPENAAFLDQNYDKIKAMSAPLMNQKDKDDKNQ